MKLDDKDWIKYWSKNIYNPVIQTFNIDEIAQFRTGTPREPYSTLWCASLSNAMCKYFKEDVIVLDYGCGFGRYFNFMSSKLKKFKYFGLEITTTHGTNCINYSKKIFKNDSRAIFDFIGSDAEKIALNESNVILLGSIFTHVSYEFFQEIFEKFINTINNGGIVIFSIILGNEYKLIEKGMYDANDCYAMTVYTADMLDKYFKSKTLNHKIVETFITRANDTHSIFIVSKM